MSREARPSEPYDVAVIGAGLQGLASARELARQGAGRVLLLEQEELGHARGGSGGPTRIYRVTYADRRYGELARAARPVWDELEAEAGESLRAPYACALFGPKDGLMRIYSREVEGAPDVTTIDAERASERFPTLRFDAQDTVLDERGAAVIAAARTLDALTRGARKAGAEIRERTPVQSIAGGPDGTLALKTPGGAIHARKVVVSAGAWTERLAPALRTQLVPVRQTVAYFRRRDGGEPVVPLWIRLGHEPNEVHYGLPTDRPDVIKIARHVTVGSGDDPDATPAEPSSAAIDDLRQAAERYVRCPVDELVDWDSCLYTMTANEHFVLDVLPSDERIVVASGFSGHGFKFGPIIGRAVADLVREGRLTRPEFAALRDSWAAPRAM